jgi:hypothetical protein
LKSNGRNWKIFFAKSENNACTNNSKSTTISANLSSSETKLSEPRLSRQPNYER